MRHGGSARVAAIGVLLFVACGGSSTRNEDGDSDAGEPGSGGSSDASGSGGKGGTGPTSTGGSPKGGTGGKAGSSGRGGTTGARGGSGGGGKGGSGAEGATGAEGGTGGTGGTIIVSGGSSGRGGSGGTTAGFGGMFGGAGAGGAGPGGAGTGGAGTITINFDDFPAGTVVTNQYAGVTFSTNAGMELRAYAPGPFGNSLPNMLCGAPTGGPVDCQGDVIMDFSPAVSPLSFLALGTNEIAVVARVHLYSGSTLLRTYDIVGGNLMATFVDVSGHSGVTRMLIDYIGDAGGIGWDDFRFYR